MRNSPPVIFSNNKFSKGTRGLAGFRSGAGVVAVAAVSCAYLACSPMHSVNGPDAVSKGLSYHLPKTVYKVSLKAKDATSVQIDVVPEVHADRPVFAIKPDRNPTFDRIQTYEVDGNGLLKSATTADVGRLPEILTDAAKSIAGIAQFSATGGLSNLLGQRDAGEIQTADEYKFFMDLLLKSNVEVSIDAGAPTREISFPGEDGSFVLRLSPPRSEGQYLDERGIRASLKLAGNRFKRNTPEDPDETILAAGVIARPVTSGQFTYAVYVKKEALNRFRQKLVEDAVKQVAGKTSTLGVMDYWKEPEVSAELSKQQTQLTTEIADLEAKRSALKVNKEGASIGVVNIAAKPETAAAEVGKMVDVHSLVVRSKEFLDSYASTLEAIRAAEPDKLDNPQKKAIIDRAAVLKAAIQTDVEKAITSVESDIKLKEASLKVAGSSKRDVNHAVSGLKKATRNALFITSTQGVSMVDTSRAQFVPMKRNAFGEATNTITVTSGVITKQEIDEKSEVWGAVKIPLTVIEAVLGTTQALWTKQGANITAETAYINAQAALITAQAKLEEARKPPATTTSSDTTNSPATTNSPLPPQ